MEKSLFHAALQKAAAEARPPLPKAARPIVIVGAGGIVRAAHLPAYEKAGFPVIAIADLISGRAAEAVTDCPGAKGFDSIAEAITYAPDDAVFDIAIPAGQLLNVLPLLPRGAAVLMQKPMGDTLDEARKIVAVCRQRELTAAVNFQLRYAPNNLGAVALTMAGALGELHDMQVQVNTYTPWHLWSFLSTAPRLEILYHSIHYVDLVRSWFGRPLGVYAKTVKSPESSKLAATKSTIVLDYGEDKRVFIATAHGHDFAETQRSDVQWEGTRGAVRMDMGVNLDYPKGKPDTLSYALRGDTVGWQNVPVSGNWFPDAFVGSMGSLQAYVEGSATELPTSVDSSFETMAVVEAAYRASARVPEPIEIA
jgi:predicted dehydrogenase